MLTTRNQTGFTLLEMMATVAIVGILAVVGWTFLQGNQANTKLRSGVGGLYSDLQEARQSAIGRNEPIGIQLSETGYAIFRDTDGDRQRNGGGLEDLVYRRFPVERGEQLFRYPGAPVTRFFTGRGYLLDDAGDLATLRAVLCLHECGGGDRSQGVVVSRLGIMQLVSGNGPNL